MPVEGICYVAVDVASRLSFAAQPLGNAQMMGNREREPIDRT